MTKPADDFEAVRLVTEALQGFDAKDQERIIRWAREKLGQAPSPAGPSPVAQPVPLSRAFDFPAAPAPTPADTTPKPAGGLVLGVPDVEARATERSEALRPEVIIPNEETYQAELPVVPQTGEQQPEPVGALAPEPEEKSRLPLMIGIIVLVVALAFLVFMIASSHPK